MIRMLVAVTAVLLVGPASASAAFPVGHTVKRITVPGTAAGELRSVEVHLWYPADTADAVARPKSVYRSALYGKPLPAQWDPLSW